MLSARANVIFESGIHLLCNIHGPQNETEGLQRFHGDEMNLLLTP